MKLPKTIETLSVETLISYARNSRTHSDAQVAQISASIKEFGFTNPVLIVQRWQDFTGQAATLEADGRTFDEVKNGSTKTHN